MSKYQVGDAVFRVDGRPTVFSGVNPESGRVALDGDKAAVKAAIRHGYINGLNEHDRARFNETMDHIRDIREPLQQVEELKAKIASLRDDPKNNLALSKYLQAEMAHIMNVNNIQPRFYEIDEYKVSK